jgi:VWFA-related protein
MASLKSIAVAAFVAAAMAAVVAQEPKQDSDKQSFRFRSGVDLINVTATVSDGQGRFVSGLKQEDFRIYEDGQQRPITHFTSERVPVSLGIVLDTSGSMEGEKILAAKQALQHLLFDLLGREDEVFLYRFDNKPRKVHGWTTDRESIWSELRRIQPNGATTLYDAIAETLPVVATGRHRKKALLIISDGNDTNSYTRISELKALIHESETLVYAIGIDGFAYRTSQPAQQPWYSTVYSSVYSSVSSVLAQRRPGPRPRPFPIPMPRPGSPGGPGSDPRGRPRPPMPDPRGPVTDPRDPRTVPGYPPSVPGVGGRRGDEPVNVGVLRDITEHSGGRAEIIRNPRDLDRATSSIADELSKQYSLGYPAASQRDGRWHAIRVEVIDSSSYVVRARRGYVATP